jgi:hypothetical protein
MSVKNRADLFAQGGGAASLEIRGSAVQRPNAAVGDVERIYQEASQVKAGNISSITCFYR